MVQDWVQYRRPPETSQKPAVFQVKTCRKMKPCRRGIRCRSSCFRGQTWDKLKTISRHFAERPLLRQKIVLVKTSPDQAVKARTLQWPGLGTWEWKTGRPPCQMCLHGKPGARQWKHSRILKLSLSLKKHQAMQRQAQDQDINDSGKLRPQTQPGSLLRFEFVGYGTIFDVVLLCSAVNISIIVLLLLSETFYAAAYPQPLATGASFPSAI